MEFIRENLFTILSALFIFAVIFLYLQNNILTVKQISIKNKKLPSSFNGFKILQISDLHGKRFGRGQKRLVERVRQTKPDIIVITGDIIDRRRFEIHPVIELLPQLCKIAPVYYSPGNHEGWSNRYDEVKAILKRFAVTPLENETISLQGKNTDQLIYLNGLLDPSFDLPEGSGVAKSCQQTDTYLSKLLMPEGFNITLCHRPEAVATTKKRIGDLVFSGHVHGGQVRIWPIGGLYAPGQGVFPKYDSGRYDFDDTTLIVSRGLGNSLFPFRLFNLPQLILVTLFCE